jgi:hypothetical protein
MTPAKVCDQRALATLAALIAPALRRLPQPTKKAAPPPSETASEVLAGDANTTSAR